MADPYTIVDPVEFLKEAMKNAYNGIAQSDFLNAALPWLTYGSNYNLQQQQMTNQLAGQQADTAARIQAAQIGAGASVQGAQIDAASRIQAQQIAVKGQLQAIEKQLAADLQKMQMGLQVDVDQFNANMQMQADLKNQDMRLEVAKLMTSTGLRDSLAARLFVEGQGTQPAMGSALLAGQLQPISAPSISMPRVPAVPGKTLANPRTASGGDLGLGLATVSSPSGIPRWGMRNADVTGGIPDVTGGIPYGNDVTMQSVPQTSYGGYPYPDYTVERAYAKGTPSAGKAYLVGEGRNMEGLRQGTAEVLHIEPNGRVEVIPLKGQAATGWSNYYNTGTTIPTTTTGTTIPTTTTAPTNIPHGDDVQKTVIPPPTSTSALPTASQVATTTGLAANTPALVALQTGQAPPAFRQYGGLIDIGLGLGNIPEPAKAASMFGRLNPWYQEDVLQAYEMAGIPRALVLWQMRQATPGWRQNPQRAFNIA